MPSGFPHHLDLTVTDIARSTVFYDKILSQLGYRRSQAYSGDVPCWIWDLHGPRFSIGLHAARGNARHDRYSPGLHHLALYAGSRERVDAFHDFLLDEGFDVLDAPAEYDYVPGYYAVFFADPDGLKLELVHEPASA